MSDLQGLDKKNTKAKDTKDDDSEPSEASDQTEQQETTPQASLLGGYTIWHVLIFVLTYYIIFLSRYPKAIKPRELEVYLTEALGRVTKDNLVWYEKNLVFGKEDTIQRYKDFNITISNAVAQGKTSLYAQILLKRTNKNQFEPKLNIIPLSYLLTKELKFKTNEHAKNLLFPKNEDKNTHFHNEGIHLNEKRVYWYPNVTIQIVNTNDSFSLDSLHYSMRKHIIVPDFSANFHFPIVFVNDFWNLKEHHILMNSTLKSLPLRLMLEPTSFFKFQVSSQVYESIRIQEETYGVDGDDIKRMIVETNPILLAITLTVSILHTVFDVLAFKNDIQFWKGRGDHLEGLSLKSIACNAFFQLIIFLYLLDESTNWLILLSVGFGVLLEFWKLTKAVNFIKKPTFPYVGFDYKSTYVASSTKEYDEMALKYLSWAAFPLLIGYAVYALVYEEFTSWYAFILRTLVGFVYAFGFIMMTPQLFINYKLKSVAHMPWKTFMYKALNTFIDDLFAFVIKMPTLHRIACLRDDVVFFIYLYQRYLYPVDKKRVNEFGQKLDPIDDESNILMNKSKNRDSDAKEKDILLSRGETCLESEEEDELEEESSSESVTVSKKPRPVQKLIPRERTRKETKCEEQHTL